MTGEQLIIRLWENCRNTARFAGVNAEAVQNLIFQSRELLKFYGCSERDVEFVFADLLTTIHWDWREPTARVFETLLEFELERFFAERS